MRKLLIYLLLNIIFFNIGISDINAGENSVNTSKCIAYWDFENIKDNAKTYISKSSNIKTGTTNNGIKSYDFVYENSNSSLLFTAYNIGEINGNASRYFEFLFDEVYSLETNPDTKLVLGFTENIIQHDTDWNYNHSVIMGNNGQMQQMFLKKEANKVLYRPNNVGYNYLYEKEIDINHKFIIDMESEDFSIDINGKAVNDIKFQNTGLAELSKIKWYPQTGQIYSIDNIYAYVIPNQFDCVTYDGNDGTGLDINQEVSFYFTAPINQNELEKISVLCGNAVVSESDYSLNADVKMENDGSMTNRVILKFNQGMKYGSQYIIELPSDFADIAGNTLGNKRILSFETQAAPSYQLSLVCLNSSGGKINNISDIIDGKLYYEIFVQNTTQRAADGAVVIGLYENNKLIKCAYFRKNFGIDEMQSVCGFFAFENAANMKIKAFVTEKLGSDSLYSDTKIFQ